MTEQPYTVPVLESGIIPDKEIIGVITPRLNCCVEKVIGEMGPYLLKKGAVFAIQLDAEPKKIINYDPKWIMLFRCGVEAGTPSDKLLAIEMHLPYYRSLGIPTYYYMDDALFYMNGGIPTRYAFSSDNLIVATEALAEHLLIDQHYPKPTYLLKTHINLPVFDKVAKPLYLVDEGRFNILFTSQGRIGANHIRQIVERMNQTPEKYKDVTVVCVSHQVAQVRSIINQYRNIKKKYWEFMPLLEFYGLCKSVQLILAPAHPNDLLYTMPDEQYRKFWLNAKSCTKYTFAGAAGIPCIATPIQEYKKAVKHAETGFLANELDEWIYYIDLMIEKQTLREEIGQAARKDIEENWGIEKRVDEFLGILYGKDDCLIIKDNIEIHGEVKEVKNEDSVETTMVPSN